MSYFLSIEDTAFLAASKAGPALSKSTYTISLLYLISSYFLFNTIDNSFNLTYFSSALFYSTIIRSIFYLASLLEIVNYSENVFNDSSNSYTFVSVTYN